jgi:hypothetical protein
VALKHGFSRSLYGDLKDWDAVTLMWTSTVSQYTSCQLTYAADKLIAFGGIASTVAGLFGKRYLAGVWLRDIAYQLCWTGKSDMRPTNKIPSWSWAATEGHVWNAFLPVHPSDVVRPLQILEGHVDLVSPDNPYGQVNGGYLRVAARLTSVRITYGSEYERFGDTNSIEREPIFWLPNSEGIYRPSPVKVDLSWGRKDIVEAQANPVTGGVLYILAVMEHLHVAEERALALRGKPQLDQRRAPLTRWIILAAADAQRATFRRCGCLVPFEHDAELFEAACRWFDSTPRGIPVHLSEPGYGTRYSVTLT